jgi:hypothetical protein
METDAYGKPIRDRELLRCIKKLAPAISSSGDKKKSSRRNTASLGIRPEK